MVIHLKYIEICNFKSFAGKNVIGPFVNFSAIVGANGSGKSNILDAISFAVGERAGNLRALRLQDLVHGAAMSRPCPDPEPYTKAVFDDDEEGGAEVSFTRIIRGNSSIYKVNDRFVDAASYLDSLKQISIDIKSKIFLVPQSEINSLMMQGAKERTEFLERLSQSFECKNDYEKAKENLKLAEESLKVLLNKKRTALTEKRMVKVEAEVANQFDELAAELNEDQLKYRLIQLKLLEIEQRQFAFEREELGEFLDEAAEELREAEEQFRVMKKERGRLSLATVTAEKVLKRLETDATKKEDACIRLEEKLFHASSKLDSVNQRLDNAVKVLEGCKETEQELKQELKMVQKSRQNYEEHFHRELTLQGGNVQLDNEQVAEYRRLKECSAKASSVHLTELNSLEMSLNADQAQLDNESRKKNDAQDKVKVVQNKLDLQAERVEKLNRFVTESQAQLEKLETKELTLSAEISGASVRMEELDKERERIGEAIREMADDRRFSDTYVKKVELIDQLRRLFPGVIGRLIDFCVPSHKKYKIAVTKAIGRYFDAIICDSHLTAIHCIRYMRDQHFDPETFLPLDSLKIRKVNERLRDVRVPGVQNVKLAIDVLSLNNPQVRPALLFVCGDCLICETVEDARAVNDQLREQTVSLDGVMFHKSGLISGGSSDLESRARRWDEREYHQLKAEKDRVIEELNRVQKTFRKKSEQSVLRSEIDGLTARIKFAALDVTNITGSENSEAERELEDCRLQLNSFDLAIAEITKRMSALRKKIEAKKADIDRICDDIFVEFCRRVGVKNIREYENKWLKLREEHDKKIFEFESHTMRLLNQVQYEESRAASLNADVEKLQRQSADENEKVERLKSDQESLSAEMRRFGEKIEDGKNSLASLKSQLDKCDGEMDDFDRTTLVNKRKTFDTTKQAIMALETRMMQKSYERHNVIKSFKFSNISLPLISGSLEDISEDLTEDEQTVGASLNSATALTIFDKESLLEVDYSMLGDQRNLTDTADAKKTLLDLENEIASMTVRLERLPPRDSMVADHLSDVTRRCKDLTKEFNEARSVVNQRRADFERVRNKRRSLFMEFFDEVSENIDVVYKSLCEDPSAQMTLGVENEEEPYLGGILFNCCAPGKRFQSIENMSGGEKAVAALALLFTLCNCCRLPFLVLDEVDASLDDANVRKVIRYIRAKSVDLPCIAVSHKKEFFGAAHALFGCYVKRSDEMSRSHVLSLNLQRYARRAPTDSVVAASSSDSSLA